jgi:hypothetical protein
MDIQSGFLKVNLLVGRMNHGKTNGQKNNQIQNPDPDL